MLSWWKRKIIYNSESVAQQFASTKNSEKHHKLEKLKKKLVQELSSNVSKISIDQQVQIEQSLENDNSEKVSTKKNKDWYETILKKIKKLNIKKNENLMTCEWSYWITCYNNEYEKHHRMKKWNW